MLGVIHMYNYTFTDLDRTVGQNLFNTDQTLNHKMKMCGWGWRNKPGSYLFWFLLLRFAYMMLEGKPSTVKLDDESFLSSLGLEKRIKREKYREAKLWRACERIRGASVKSWTQPVF